MRKILLTLTLFYRRGNQTKVTWSMQLARLMFLEKAMATHYSTVAWEIPWTEEPGRLQSMRSLRVWHDWETSLSLSCIGEGNGNLLQCSCLENPRDGGAWWATICGVAQSWTRLNWLSSSSMFPWVSLSPLLLSTALIFCSFYHVLGLDYPDAVVMCCSGSTEPWTVLSWAGQVERTVLLTQFPSFHFGVSPWKVLSLSSLLTF